MDGQSAEAYEANLMENLQSLLNRAKSGTYRAPPVRRVHIPKGGSPTETRPIGIPTFEDKILQRAVVMILEPIYEHDFEDCSYGFRPGRSAHDGLKSLWKQTMRIGGGWILEIDIRKFFDELDHGHLRAFLRHRVRDGVLLRLIGKWLKAGVVEAGSVSYPDSGPGTFDFLGFTHYWAKSRRGNWVVKQKTARGRFTRAVQSIAQWCKRHRHEPIPDQHARLNQKLRGHYAYYGITGNSQSLPRFRHEVTCIWRKWLGRRRRSDHLTWERFYRLLERYPLAPAIAVHSIYRHAAKP